MRWSKIKNIIILLLVVVNGFLLAQVGLREWRSRQDERETRERMVDILSRNDLSYLPDEVPGTLELSGCRVTLSPLGEAEAALLVGQVTTVQTSGSQTVYTGAEGSLTISSTGELSAQFLSDSSLSEAGLLDRLSKLGVALQPAGREGENAAYVLLYDGVPVPEETALLTFYSGGAAVHTLTLRRLAGTEELLPSQETITASTALARLLEELSRGEGYVCSQITQMYPGYVPSGTTTVTLTPAWFIETDTWRFIVDGYTGAVTATE